MPDDPKNGEQEPQAGGAADPQAGKTGARGGDDPQAGESISLEKARELRSENKGLRDRLKALEDEKTKRDEDARKAEEAKAKEEGRLSDVLKAREDELATLKPRADLATKLEGLFTTQFDDESKEWPDEVKALVPEGLEARIDQWPRLRAAAAKLSTAPPRPGNGRDPKPAGALSPAAELEQKKRELRQSGGYGRF